MSNNPPIEELYELFNSIRRSKSNPKKSWTTYSTGFDESERELNLLKEELQTYWKIMDTRAMAISSHSN
ncbi:MAG: hypothetical protein ACTSRK_05220 [Promethearchaeota archaeon]